MRRSGHIVQGKPKVGVSVTTGPTDDGASAMGPIAKTTGRKKADPMADSIPKQLREGGEASPCRASEDRFEVGTASSFVSRTKGCPDVRPAVRCAPPEAG